MEGKEMNCFIYRVISKHTKIDTFVDSGSQVNLISEQVVQKLGLETMASSETISFGLDL
jgi:hypothetical protein